MKKFTALLLTVLLIAFALCSCGDETKKTGTSETGKTEAFAGMTAEEILNAIVEKAKEMDETEYGIKSIECANVPVDKDGCERILGLSEEEFDTMVETAVESKPNASYIAHSVVVIKLKEGTDVNAAASKIIENTVVNRFGCLKPHALLGSSAGQFVFFAATGDEDAENLFNAFKELSGTDAVKTVRENTWSSSGGLLG